MKFSMSVFLTALICIPGVAMSRPAVDGGLPLIMPVDATGTPSQSAGVLSLSSGSSLDTVWYGGTRWAADSLRWEALRDSVWTFDTGIGSSINTGFNPNKPVGYHQTMEGWFGIDQTFWVTPYFRRSSTCAINGSFSAWAGVTEHEADNLCYAAGRGYGNLRDIYYYKVFNDPGTGGVTLSYLYAVESEPGFDYVNVTWIQPEARLPRDGMSASHGSPEPRDLLRLHDPGFRPRILHHII